MAKGKPRKLKVFQAQMGFYDTVVAAPNRAAALRAWGTRQDLFASGQATPVDEPEVIEAARAHPEVPLRRAVGSTAPFGLEAGLPEVPDGPKKAKAARASKPKPDKPRKPPPDRSTLDAAEAALRELDAARKREMEALRRRQEALEAEMSAAQTAYVRAREAAHSLVAKSRKAYRQAGGRD